MDVVGIDTETTGLNRWTGCRPFAVSAHWGDDRHRYWEWEVDPATRRPLFDSRLDEVRELVSSRKVRKYFFNGKFDVLMLEAAGVEVDVDPARFAEVSWMARACDNSEPTYELKRLAARHAGIPDDDEEELRASTIRARLAAKRLGWPRAEDVEADYWMPRTLWLREPAEAARCGARASACRKYALRDAERTLVLGLMYEAAMDELGVRGVYDAEMELFNDTVDMERVGVVVDLGRIERCRRACQADLEAATSRLSKAYGGEFNPQASAHVQALLFQGRPLRLPVELRTPKGNPKTDVEALMLHRGEPLVDDVMRARANAQALKLFFNKYPQLVTREGGEAVLHPGFNQWGTLTGRYSCSEPNMQQVSDPKTTNSLAAEFVVDVRQVFTPRRGHVWYCPDYSQIEVVIFADLSGEPTMCEALLRGDDIHAAVAEKVWGGRDNPRAAAAAAELCGGDFGAGRALLEECGWSITRAEARAGKKLFRKRAKAVTFTKIFGGGYKALMRWIQVARAYAERVLAEYEDSFPTLVRRAREIELEGARNRCVVNPYGRRLEVDPFEAYKAVNHLVQSTAADLMKRGMRSCAAWLRGEGARTGGRIAMTIHDELIFEFPRRRANAAALSELSRRMSDHGGALKLPVQVNVDVVRERWSEKEGLEL